MEHTTGLGFNPEGSHKVFALAGLNVGGSTSHCPPSSSQMPKLALSEARVVHSAAEGLRRAQVLETSEVLGLSDLKSFEKGESATSLGKVTWPFVAEDPGTEDRYRATLQDIGAMPSNEPNR